MKKKDKARKEIGTGEIVTLTLTRKGGKPLNKNTKVAWTKKGNEATLRGRGTNATLTADLIMENNNVTIKAEADDFPPAEISFNIKKPTHVTGKKREKYGKQSNIGFGIIGSIIITVHPTSVSFARCGVIEKDGGTVMCNFLNSTKSKSYSDEPVFVPAEKATAMLKRNMEIMENAFSEIAQIRKKGTGKETDKKINDVSEEMNKRIHDNNQQFKDSTVVINTQTSRNLLLKNIMERSEKNFMILLTHLFPEKNQRSENISK